MVDMETVGLIGGMSWHSTATYYRIINEVVAAARGGHASARVALQSLDFEEVRQCQVDGDWDRAAALLSEAGRRCESGGATTVAICTNLMHKVAPQVEDALGVPLLHIGDAVGTAAVRNGWRTLGILGARWVMEETFYADRLARHGVAAVVPGAADRELVDRVVFDELTHGIVRDASRAAYVDVIRRLAGQGADAVVLACTEIGLLIGPDDSPLPVIDSAEVHARELGRVALGSLVAP
jgi:aspartate racemase